MRAETKFYLTLAIDALVAYVESSKEHKFVMKHEPLIELANIMHCMVATEGKPRKRKKK